MPIYEYRCENGHTFEVTQRMIDDPLTSCTICGAPVQRVFHPVAVHFKGSGFYNTDYGKKKAGALVGLRLEVGRSRSPRIRSPPRTRSRPPRRKSSAAPPPPTSPPFRSLSTASARVPGDTWMSPSRSQQVPSSTSVSSELPVATSANRPISDGPFMSVLSALGACQLTHGSRKNVLGDLAWAPIARSTSCWRAARARSSSAGAHGFLRTRA